MKIIEKIQMPNGKTRTRVSFKFEQPSKTDQSFKEDCDVNIIMDRFMKTGQISHLAKKQASYQDVSEIPNLLDAHISIKEAKEAFMALPARIRKKLHNDPLNLEEYLLNEENHEEAAHYGLLKLDKPLQKKTKNKDSENSKKPSATPNDKTNDSTDGKTSNKKES